MYVRNNPSQIAPLTNVRQFASAAELRAARQALKDKFAALQGPVVRKSKADGIIVRTIHDRKPLSLVKPFIARVNYGFQFGPWLPKPEISLIEVRELVARHFGYAVHQIIKTRERGRDGNQHRSHTRMIAAVCCYEFGSFIGRRSLNTAASMLGLTNHTTLHYARRSMAQITRYVSEQPDLTAKARVELFCKVAASNVGLWSTNWSACIGHYEMELSKASRLVARSGD